MRNSIIACCVLILTAVMILGCARLEKYGQAISNHEITKVSDIFRNPQAYNNKTVTVEGKIITECPTGCWVDLKDETGAIYADFNPSNFAIPQKVGSRIKIEGKIKVESGKPTMIGKGVELK